MATGGAPRRRQRGAGGWPVTPRARRAVPSGSCAAPTSSSARARRPRYTSGVTVAWQAGQGQGGVPVVYQECNRPGSTVAPIACFLPPLKGRCLLGSLESLASTPSPPSPPLPSPPLRSPLGGAWCGVPAQAPSLDLSSLRFGAQFTAHMLQIPWSRDHGWGAPVIAPVGPIPMHPAAQVRPERSRRLHRRWGTACALMLAGGLVPGLQPRLHAP